MYLHRPPYLYEHIIGLYRSILLNCEYEYDMTKMTSIASKATNCRKTAASMRAVASCFYSFAARICSHLFIESKFSSVSAQQKQSKLQRTGD